MRRRLTVIALACILATGGILCHVFYVHPWSEERERRRILRDVFTTITERGPEAFTSCQYAIPSELLPVHIKISDYVKDQSAAAMAFRKKALSYLESDEIAEVIPTYHIPMVQSPRTFELLDPQRYSWKLSVGGSEYEVRRITSALLATRNGRQLEVAFTGASGYVMMVQIGGRWYVELAFDWCVVTELDYAARSSEDADNDSTAQTQPTDGDPPPDESAAPLGD